MFKIAICNHNRNAVNQIETLIYEISKEVRLKVDVDVYETDVELENKMFKGKYDILYVEWKEREMTICENIRKIDKNVLIIFTISNNTISFDTFEIEVFAFLKIPIERDCFKRIYLEASRRLTHNNYYFVFSYKNEEFKICFDSILYFESKGRQIIIHTYENSKQIFNGKLADVEGKICNGKTPFLRIHQSYLVNYHMINARTKSEVMLIDGTRLPISEDKRKKINREYECLLKETHK